MPHAQPKPFHVISRRYNADTFSQIIANMNSKDTIQYTQQNQ